MESKLNFPVFVKKTQSSTDNYSNQLINRLIIACSKGIHYIPHEDIIHVQADGGYCHIITTDDIIFVSKTLKHIQNKLLFDNFIRIHNSHLINLNYLRFKGINYLKMSNGDTLKISRAKKSFLRFRKISSEV